MTAPVTPTRAAPILVGDSLRRIALRELGDALRWWELADINQLRPPYIIDSVDPADRQRATLIYGDFIRVPVGAVTESVQTPADLFGLDCVLADGYIQPAATGDWATLAGSDNLTQALGHRLKTERGDLLGHPTYGSQIPLALGLRNLYTVQLMVIGFARQALKQDPRIATVHHVTTVPAGDSLRVRARIQPVARNEPLDLNLVFPFP